MFGGRFAKEGKLTTLDVNEDLAYLPKNILPKVNLLLKLIFSFKMQRVFENSDEIFDLIFIDADKENYAEYLKLVKPRMKSEVF